MRNTTTKGKPILLMEAMKTEELCKLATQPMKGKISARFSSTLAVKKGDGHHHHNPENDDDDS